MKKTFYYKETKMGWYEVLNHLEEISLSLKEKRDMSLNSEKAEGYQKQIEALQNAMTSVLREIPQKPAEIYSLNNVVYGRCPNPYCNHTGLRPDSDFKCRWCGTKIDWEFDMPMNTEEFNKKVMLGYDAKEENTENV